MKLLQTTVGDEAADRPEASKPSDQFPSRPLMNYRHATRGLISIDGGTIKIHTRNAIYEARSFVSTAFIFIYFSFLPYPSSLALSFLSLF